MSWHVSHDYMYPMMITCIPGLQNSWFGVCFLSPQHSPSFRILLRVAARRIMSSCKLAHSPIVLLFSFSMLTCQKRIGGFVSFHKMVYFYLCIFNLFYLSVYLVHGIQVPVGAVKRLLNPLMPELQVHHRGAGNQTQVLWKSSKRS